MEKTGSVTKPKLKQLTTPVPPPPLPPLPDKPGTDLVAKSPPEPPKAGTLQSSSDESAPRRDADTVRVLQYAGLQMVCAVLMLVLGVLTLVHHSAMGRWGAGLWGGGAAAATGLAGLMAALRGFYHPGEQLGATGVTVYLALCLVSLATTTLAIVITSTGLLRDLHAPVVDEDPEALTAWAPVLSSLGLLLASVLLAVSLVAASLRVYRRVCPCTRPPPHRLLESPASSLGKQGLVHSWLGLPPQASPMPPVLYPAAPQPLMVYPPPLMVEGSGLYTMPPSTIGYPQCISPLPSNPYMQRRRSPHPRGRNSVTPDSAKRSRRPEKRDREPAKEREITDEQLEKTYTGLDREIAEEFISIAMTNSGNSTRSGQRRTSRGDKVIDCIAPQ